MTRQNKNVNYILVFNVPIFRGRVRAYLADLGLWHLHCFHCFVCLWALLFSSFFFLHSISSSPCKSFLVLLPVAIMSAPNLLSLQTEILFHIFKRLDRPSKLALGLTCPRILAPALPQWLWCKGKASLSSNYLLGWSPGSGNYNQISDSPRWGQHQQRAIIADHWRDEPEVQHANPVFSTGVSFGGEEVEVIPPYTESSEAREDAMVASIISEWLKTKFRIDGGCILWVECGRYMLCRGPDGRRVRWTANQMRRSAYVLPPSIQNKNFPSQVIIANAL